VSRRVLLGASVVGVVFAAPAMAANLPMTVSADKDASWELLCKIQSYRDKNGGVFNRYGVRTKGAYAETIPSPNADCALTLTEGKGPVTLRVVRFGKKPFLVTANAVGQKVEVSVF
jgi:hypothetical protein